MTWRDDCKPIIAAVLSEAARIGMTQAETRKALRAAYPYGQRKCHPYKIWCDEVARQQGRKGKLGARKLGARKPQPAKGPDAPDPRQVDLFGDAS